MNLIKDKEFGGERPLFGLSDMRLEHITITDGESGIKFCRNIECDDSRFYGKYPGGTSTAAISPTAISRPRAAVPSGTPTTW